MPDDIKRAFNMGVDDYITKPFDPMLLGRTIREKLDKYVRAKSA
jgi:DNA-binding response OmpR family regulator